MSKFALSALLLTTIAENPDELSLFLEKLKRENADSLEIDLQNSVEYLYKGERATLRYVKKLTRDKAFTFDKVDNFNNRDFYLAKSNPFNIRFTFLGATKKVLLRKLSSGVTIPSQCFERFNMSSHVTDIQALSELGDNTLVFGLNTVFAYIAGQLILHATGKEQALSIDGRWNNFYIPGSVIRFRLDSSSSSWFLETCFIGENSGFDIGSCFSPKFNQQ